AGSRCSRPGSPARARMSCWTAPSSPPAGRSSPCTGWTRRTPETDQQSGRVRLQPLGPRGVAQLEQAALLDLADPLPGQAALAPHLVQGALPAVVQAEP